MTVPYTYLLKHLPTGKFYYGCRYANGCNPLDFWTKYKTSSKYIKKLIEEYGSNSFQYEIRKTFSDVNSARIWEHKVLKRMRVVSRTDFINRTDNISISVEDANIGRTTRVSTNKHKQAISKVGKSNIGKILPIETKNKISQSLIGNKRKLGKKESEYTKLKKSLSKIGKSSGMLGKTQKLCSCLECKKVLPYPNFIQHLDRNH
jgi:hypothetical protein